MSSIILELTNYQACLVALALVGVYRTEEMALEAVVLLKRLGVEHAKFSPSYDKDGSIMWYHVSSPAVPPGGKMANAGGVNSA